MLKFIIIMSLYPFVALILAAGYAKRMQYDKLLLPWNGKALLRHVVDHAKDLGLADVFIVIRNDVDSALTNLIQDTTMIISCEAHKGMGASLASGIRCIKDQAPPSVSGAMIFLGDMPAMQKSTLHALCQKALATPDIPHAPSYNAIQGHPVIIPKHLWPLLTQADNDGGAKDVLKKHGLELMPTDDPYVCMDIDTPNAYQALLQQKNRT